MTNSSDITCLSIKWISCSLSISNLKSGYISYWNSYKNANVVGQCSNVTILDSTARWAEMFFDKSNASVEGSEINSIWIFDSNVTIINHSGAWIHVYGSSTVAIYDTAGLSYLAPWGGEPNLVVFNSTIYDVWAENFQGHLFCDETLVSGIETYESQFYVSGNFSLLGYGRGWENSYVTRNFDVIVTNEDDQPLVDVEFRLFDQNKNLMWRGFSNSYGRANFNLTFSDNNYTDILRLEAVKETLSSAKNITFLSETPIMMILPFSRTIYIRSDGSIDPPTAPIHRDGDLYTLTDDIFSDMDGIVIERNNMTLDGAGYTLKGTDFLLSNGIYLSERSNVTIKETNIKGFASAIHLYLSSNNTISGNDIADNGGGITLFGSSNNTISENNLMTNNGSGIFVFFFSSNNIISRNDVVANKDGIFFAKGSDSNTVFGNNITLNEDWGIGLHISDNSTISGNNIEGNKYGIYVYKASNNTIYHNNFIDNTQQVYDPSWNYSYVPPSINAWDSGYLSGGNYWSDYEERYPDAVELDGSGIWDAPYFIYENNQDNFPLMGPWTPIDELKAEIEELGSEGEIDNQGIVNSLIAKLNAAQKLVDKGKIDEAKSILEEDFVPQVQNLSGIHITPEAADNLIESAEYILSHL